MPYEKGGGRRIKVNMNHLIHLGLTVLSYVYFNVVHVVFTVINYIYPRRIVPRPTNRILLLSATKLAEKIRNGELTSFEVINAYIARVEEVNPIINAMVYPNFDNARKEAKAVDHYLSNLDKDSDEFKNLAKTKPILGVPFTLKDIIKVKGMNCSMGVPARANYIADEDAAYVKQLKDAGGIVLGTTNVPELAMWLETNNHLHGMTNNPYDSRRIPGGSSGGEGALIAAAGSVIGIGSDIGGSIRMPSFFSGIFGFKNTQFLIDRTGHEPEGLTAGGLRNEMFVVGPMCRYIEDIPLMMKIGNPEKCEKFKLDDPIDLSKVRLYYMEGIKSLVMEPLHCDILAKLHEAITYLETECRMTSVKVDFPEMKSGFGFWVTDLESKECPSFAKLATDFHGEANFVAEFGKCLIGRSDHTMAVIIGGLIEHFGGIHSDDRKKELRRIHEKMRTELHALLEKNAVLLFPGFSYPAPYHHQALWSGCNIAYTSIFNSMGLPSLAVPTGLNKDGLPTGVQIVGAPNNDALLLAVGRKLDKGFGGWTAPGLSVQ
uniref:Amidase domain-containing protein n=1 Tax=Steinernema glaseri TaxID=37863 RepID=A0A1I7Y6Z9_9BILA